MLALKPPGDAAAGPPGLRTTPYNPEPPFPWATFALFASVRRRSRFPPVGRCVCSGWQLRVRRLDVVGRARRRRMLLDEGR
jgi:hypothetical protein